MNQTKHCKGCNSLHPATKEIFGVNRRNKDGLMDVCKKFRKQQRNKEQNLQIVADKPKKIVRHKVNISYILYQTSIIVVFALGFAFCAVNGSVALVGTKRILLQSLDKEFAVLMAGIGTAASCLALDTWYVKRTLKYALLFFVLEALCLSVEGRGVYEQVHNKLVTEQTESSKVEVEIIQDKISKNEDTIAMFPTLKDDGDMRVLRKEARGALYDALRDRKALARELADVKSGAISEPKFDILDWIVFFGWLLVPRLTVITAILGRRELMEREKNL